MINVRVIEDCKKVLKQHKNYVVSTFQTLACESKYPFISKNKL